jgi:hypothetical protein
MVCQVRKTIAKVYNGYSPNHAFVDTAIGRFMFTLFASQISALFTNTERVVRYTLLHKLAQIFTGMKLYHGANHLETLPLIPQNYIHYKLALVMCGNMIDKFIRNGNLNRIPVMAPILAPLLVVIFFWGHISLKNGTFCPLFSHDSTSFKNMCLLY